MELSEDCKDSLTEWYHRLTVVGLEKKFYTCKGRNSVTVVELWWKRARRRAGPGVTRLGVTGDGTGKKRIAEVQMLTPFGELTTPIDQSGMVGRTKMLKVLAAAIKLLHQFIYDYVEMCGEIIEVRTNVARFEKYIRKHCYPKRLSRLSYIRSVAIQRMLEGPQEGKKHPVRELKAYYIY